jgi:UrcA family protein
VNREQPIKAAPKPGDRIMKPFRTTILAACAAVAASGAAQAATEKVSLHLNRQDLASFNGRAAAITHIHRAARSLCHVGESMLDHLQQWQCERRISDQLVRQVDSPELLAQWQGKRPVRTSLLR